MVLDPFAAVALVCAFAAILFSVIWAVLLGKGVRIGKKWVKLKESETQIKSAESTEANLRTLMATMDDVKHRLEEI